METEPQHRPRNIDLRRATGILYGDWGTSKAYVTGLAFALAMYSSFWFVLAVSLLTALVAVNYIWVCKHFPEGGGVYSAARAHSPILAMVGGLLLVANYIVTAALSSFVAFQYFGLSPAEAARWAAVAIFLIGVLNFFGPRHSGSLAIYMGVITAICVGILALFCLPHLGEAMSNLQRPKRAALEWWVAFVGVILALSGVESIANLTGLMKLDPDATAEKPSVRRVSRNAILIVMAEVCLLTVLFGLAMLAIPNMDAKQYEANMLRHMAEVFVDEPLAKLPLIGAVGQLQVFSWALSAAMALLLLSAANTAIIGFVSVVYLMSRDGEFPRPFAMLNRRGVPWILMLIAIIAPTVTVEIFSVGERGLRSLADLYAIGVVGTIAVNLGSCALNRKLTMPTYERAIMAFTCLLMAAIEITIAVTKPYALGFALVVLALGFAARFFSRTAPVPQDTLLIKTQPIAAKSGGATTGKTKNILVAAKIPSVALDFAIEQARFHGAVLHLIFVRQIAVNAPLPQITGQNDPEATAVFQHVKERGGTVEILTHYRVSDDPTAVILETCTAVDADYLILGSTHRSFLGKILRGDTINAITRRLPAKTKLLIFG